MPHRHHFRPEDRHDADLRRNTNLALEQFNRNQLFVADESICAIWNIFFSEYGAYKSDLDVLKSLANMSRVICNLQCTRVIEKEIEILQGNDDFSPEYIRPSVGVLCSEDKRNKIRSRSSRSDRYMRYLINFESKFDYSRKIFNRINPQTDFAILDVGTGGGFLPYILKYNGINNVDTFDIPEPSNAFDTSCQILGVEKMRYKIERQVPMMNFGQKYDIIVCGMLQFDCNSGRSEDPWTVEDWSFFLSDVHNHHLTDTGFIYLGFTLHAIENRDPSVNAAFETYLDKGFKAGGLGAKLTKDDIAQFRARHATHI